MSERNSNDSSMPHVHIVMFHSKLAIKELKILHLFTCLIKSFEEMENIQNG